MFSPRLDHVRNRLQVEGNGIETHFDEPGEAHE
jgi:hypothetical protein